MTKLPRTFTQITALSFCFLLCVSVTSVAQTAGKVKTLAITDQPRPIAAAVKELSHEHEWFVTYEDLTYQYAGDLQDYSAEMVRLQKREPSDITKPFIGPRRGSVSITYGAQESAVQVIQQIADEYSKSNGSVFEVRKLGNRIVVLPSKEKDKDGRLIAVTPVLSTPINISEMDRNGEEAFLAICQALSEATGVKFSRGVGVPLDRIENTRLSAIDEPARDVLARFLDSVIGNRVVWRLYYGPREQTYGLNLDYIAPLNPPVLQRGTR